MSAGEALRRGGCRCGAVRFVARGAPLRIGVCHCASCRRATGSPFATFLDYALEQVSFEGAPAVWSSRPGAERLFCARCGTPIGFRDVDEPREANLYLGAFDEHVGLTPHDVTHAEEALDWARRALAPILEEPGR